MGGASDDVFLSYDHDDRDRVRPLVEALEQRGVSVFWDREIPAGSTWDEVLEQRFGAARWVVVVWTVRSRESEWVRTEASRARKQRKLLPVRLDDVEPPLEFDRVQCADLTGWEPGAASEALEELVRRIGAGPGAAPDGREGSGTRRSWLVPLAAAVVVVAAAIGALGWLARSGRGPTALVALVLAVAAAGAAIGADAAVRGVALALRRTYGARTRVVASALAAALAIAAGWAVGDDRRTVTLRLRADGECPAALERVALVVELLDAGDARPAQLRASRCDAKLAAPRAYPAARVRLRLSSQEAFVLAEPSRAYPLDARAIDVPVRAAGDAPRLDLVLYRFEGTEHGRDKFNELKGVLVDNTRMQAQSLASAAGFEYLGGLNVRYVDRALEGSAEQVSDSWRSEHALAILAGTVYEQAQFTVDSQMYLGDLDAAHSGIALRTRIHPDELERAWKAHWAAVLYALAMDARKLGKRQDVVVRCLSDAREAASDARGERGMPELLARIDAALRSEGAGPP